MNLNTIVSTANAGVKALTYGPTVLRILFVIDGRIKLNHAPDAFGLGFVLDTLRTPWTSAAAVDVGIATREQDISDDARDGNSVIKGFTFTQEGFNIDEWDQIWFFVDRPNQFDGGTMDGDENIVPLSDAEAKVLAEWMDRGGGVFATGDHGVLGASACSRIPRVRTMRRWKVADGVPPNEGPNRNQTLQGEPNDGSEGDLLLQPVALVYWLVMRHGPISIVQRPHPLLCSQLGPIDHFPDHMHEGEIVADDQVQIDRPLDIPGYTRQEYPLAIPEVATRAIGGVSSPLLRPRPQIIAYGTTTESRYLAPNADVAIAARLSIFDRKSFGLVSVYDGDPANVGRVVCDSTWHHWLSFNLHGIAAANNTDYHKMQAYYRNIALWLARPSKRSVMSLASVWSVLTLSSPMAFSDRHTTWDMGDRALALLESYFSPCWIRELVAAQLDASSLYQAKRADESRRFEPDWSAFPEELVNRAVLGSLCHALKPLAADVRQAQLLRNEVKVDPKQIESLAARGAANAVALIRESLETAVKELGALRDSVVAAEKRYGHPASGEGGPRRG